MKKLPYRKLLCLALALLTAFAWALPAGAETGGRHRIEMHEYPLCLGPSEDDVFDADIPLYFIDGADDLPWMDVEDWAELLYFVNADLFGDEGYDLYIDYTGSSVILERENGYTLEFDFENDRLIFQDYDAFMHRSDDTTLIDLVTLGGTGADGSPSFIRRNREDSFDRYGDMLTVDLAAYGIEMIAQDDGYLVPLQTLNDFTLLPAQRSFIFNGQLLFLANDTLFFDYDEGEYTEAAELYYDAPAGPRSEALAEYGYNELCLLLDTFYGLKDAHDIAGFREMFWQIGYDEVLSGSSALDADNALKSIIDYYLDDLHSTFNEYSYLAGLNSISGSTGMANRKHSAHSDAYSEARDAAYPDGWLEYEEVGNTAYITFDTFLCLGTGETYYENELPPDTVAQIIDAHARITRPDSPIENVVLDLSNNTGGDVDAAVAVLSWFLGDAPFSVKNMATGAMSTAVYRADINLDHEFDERDTVADKNLFCLVSPVSFSCGNLVPAAFKSSQKVTLIGRTTGGGSCVVQPVTTAWGTVFDISAPQRMSFLKNGSFYDIDQGVEPDCHISRIANFYDRAAMTDFVNGLF